MPTWDGVETGGDVGADGELTGGGGGAVPFGGDGVFFGAVPTGGDDGALPVG